MSAHRSELHDDSIDFEHRCIECGDEALDRCQCCGAPLCGRHHETGGGFCQDFTSVETDLGRIPACIRRVGDSLEVDSNPRLLHAEDDLPDPDDVTRGELEDAVRERLPEALFERAARDLADIVQATQDNQILGKGWAMHIVLKRMAAGERDPDAEALETMIDMIDDLLRRVERATDDETDVHIANDYSIAIDLALVRDEIERVRGTDLVDTDGEELVTDGGLTEACPHCDSAAVDRRDPESIYSPLPASADRYRCEDCGRTFDQPEHRDPRRQRRELSAELAQSDPEDFGLSPLGGGPR